MSKIRDDDDLTTEEGFTGHPTAEELLDVLEGRVTFSQVLKDRFGSLLSHCQECRVALNLPWADRFGWVKDERANNELLTVLLVAIKQGSEGLERWATREADELLALDATDRRALLEADSDRFRVPFLVDELLERCEELLTQDAARALEIAELAVEVSLRVDPQAFGSLAFHARARAEAHRANCLRINDERVAAQNAFRHAFDLYRRSEVPEPEIEAELQLLEASLATDQRRFNEAEQLLADAFQLYRSLDDARSTLLTLLKMANVQYHRGQPDAGREYLSRAASLLHRIPEVHLHWTIRYSQVLYAVESGNVEDAREYYQRFYALLKSKKKPWFALRLIWLRAKMAHVESDSNAATNLYTRARKGFVAAGFGYDAALVSLELALLHLEKGDTSSVQQLATEMLPIFHTQDIHREALAALALFQQSARSEEITVELVIALRRYLQLVRRDPTLKFEGIGSP